MRELAYNGSTKTRLLSCETALDPEACRRELDDESISELIGFFRLLDKWDREQKEEKSRESGGES